MNQVDELKRRIEAADQRYGDFASSHEALGVALEEFRELTEAVHMNAAESIAWEALDLAAVAIRLAHQILVEGSPMRRRSGCR